MCPRRCRPTCVECPLVPRCRRAEDVSSGCARPSRTTSVKLCRDSRERSARRTPAPGWAPAEVVKSPVRPPDLTTPPVLGFRHGRRSPVRACLRPGDMQSRLQSPYLTGGQSDSLPHCRLVAFVQGHRRSGGDHVGLIHHLPLFNDLNVPTLDEGQVSGLETVKR